MRASFDSAALAMATAIVLAAPAAAQQPVPLTFDFDVNTELVLDPAAAVAALDEGGFVIVWERTLSSDTALLKAQRFDADGGPTGEDIEVPAAAMAGLSVAALPGGAFVATYNRSPVGASSDAQLAAESFAADGSSQGGFTVSPDGHEVASHALARLADDELVAVWHSAAAPPGFAGLYGQRFRTDGELIGGPFEISTAGSRPRVASAGDGAFVVVWLDGTEGAVFARHFPAPVANAVPAGPTAPVRLDAGDFMATGPILATAPGGGFLALWTAADGDDARIFARRTDAGGHLAGEVFEVAAGAGSRPRQLAVALDPAGVAWVTWTGGTLEGSDIFARLVDPSGLPRSEVLRVNLFPLDRQRNPTLAVGGLSRPGGRALFAWQSRVDFTDAVIGRLFDGPCAAGTALCLGAQRFRAEVAWRDFDDRAGPGRLVPVSSDDSGLFYFFDPDNWEMLVKVLDGCGFNGHFWVFAASTTNVEFTLRVTDAATGAVQEYFNPLGVAAPAITDTFAFATCAALP